jgi:SAM-dependent methyltransferase
MHDISYNAMKVMVDRYVPRDLSRKIVDVGSYEYTGTYRSIFDNPLWHYIGADIRPGPNVDIIWDDSIPSNYFDVVISGQTVEHVDMPWIFIQRLYRVCAPGGLLILIAPWRAPVHKAPLDCWRMLPDGAEALLKYGGFEVLEIQLLKNAVTFDDSRHGSQSWGDDTVAVGRKP